jgi:hypothetical protein
MCLPATTLGQFQQRTEWPLSSSGVMDGISARQRLSA